MQNPRRWIIPGSLILVGLGVVTLVMSIVSQGRVNLSLPLVLLVLSVITYRLAAAFIQRSSWGALLYIPGSLLVALGLVFLINIITFDWNSWAYAWLLLLTGSGIGVLLANRDRRWPPEVNLAALGTVILSLVLFVAFGAIAAAGTGGLFIQVMAPLLLVAGGLALRWVRPETFRLENLLSRFNPSTPKAISDPAPDQAQLIEPLSARELEVLRLIDRGLSNPEIAERLTLAPSTVKTHINNIYGKLGVQGRVHALNRARELGLLPAQERE